MDLPGDFETGKRLAGAVEWIPMASMSRENSGCISMYSWRRQAHFWNDATRSFFVTAREIGANGFLQTGH
jgi:hypothetical protein